MNAGMFDLSLLPSGHIHCVLDSTSETKKNAIVSAFAKHPGAGLFALAATKDDVDMTASVRFWRELACTYMTERCHFTATTAAQLVPLEPAPALQTLLLNAPPMSGAEYLSLDGLHTLWKGLDDWVCQQVQDRQVTLTEFLKKHAPRWRQVGRVCFHLAENKNDPDYPFAFLATYTPQLSRQGRAQHQPLGHALRTYAGAGNKKVLVNLLLPVKQAAQSSALIHALVDSGDIYQPLAWTPNEAYQFLQETLVYEQAGVIVRLPDWWKSRPRPKINVTLAGQSKRQFVAEEMLKFDLQMVIGEQHLSEDEWQQLMQAEDGLVLLKGQWIEVDKDKLQQALTHWQDLQSAHADGITLIQGMRLLAGAEPDLSVPDEAAQDWSLVTAGAGLQQLLERLGQPDKMQSALPGKALQATLRPYQKVGVNWLWFLSQLGLGACLADDMGLGKTIQVISLLLVFKKKAVNKPSLLVLPASLLGNWQDELEKFAPSLSLLFVHPSYADKQAMLAMTDKSALQGVDLVLTTYGMLLRQSWLCERQWRCVILDEAQAIKNPGSKQTKAVKSLLGDARIALTGTPVENRLADLWSLFDFLCPGLLGSATRFKTFIQALEKREQQQWVPLRNLVRPYILRRMKTDKTIIKDLPDKTEVLAYCNLTKPQAVLYQKSVKEMALGLQTLDGMARRGLVLKYLIRFKQICNHPSQLLGDGFYQPNKSGKFARLAEICAEIASRQEKVLVFTQFREITRPLADFLATCFDRSGLVLDGSTSVPKRRKLVEQFQQEEGPPFFVISIRAGGTGLNLTAASHVIHFDRWWNPAVENQATDRAFRIGQKRNVLVHKFVCQGTIEEKIDALITQKSALANDVIEGEAQTLLTEMSNQALLDLVKLDVNQV